MIEIIMEPRGFEPRTSALPELRVVFWDVLISGVTAGNQLLQRISFTSIFAYFYLFLPFRVPNASPNESLNFPFQNSIKRAIQTLNLVVKLYFQFARSYIIPPFRFRSPRRDVSYVTSIRAGGSHLENSIIRIKHIKPTIFSFIATRLSKSMTDLKKWKGKRSPIDAPTSDQVRGIGKALTVYQVLTREIKDGENRAIAA